MTQPRPHPHHGFTLIELMITLAILTILLVTAIPSFSAMIANNRITAQANQFITAMNVARSEAVKRGVIMDVIATDGSDTGDEWGAGWHVDISGGATVQVFPALDGSSKLNSANDTSTYRYQASGRANVTDTLTLCDDRTGETGRQITLSTTGHVSVADVACP